MTLDLVLLLKVLWFWILMTSKFTKGAICMISELSAYSVVKYEKFKASIVFAAYLGKPIPITRSPSETLIICSKTSDIPD